jgi:hypothetical protein
MKGLSGAVMNFGALRANRRRELISTGLSLASSIACAQLSASIKPHASVAQALKKIAANANLVSFDVSSYSVGGATLSKAIYAKAIPKRVYHVILGDTAEPTEGPIQPGIAVVVEAQNEKIISVREYQKR